MPSSSLSWQQGLAGRNPAISFLTSAENEMTTTSLGVLAPKVQSTERMTAPHTLLELYHEMVMARAIERQLWVLEDMEGVDGYLPVTGFEAVQVAAAAALRPGRDWIVPCPTDLALCLAVGLSPLDVMLAVFGRANDPASRGRQTPGAFGTRAARLAMPAAAPGPPVVTGGAVGHAPKGGLGRPEELEAVAGQDPIDRMRGRLLEAGVLEAADDEQIQRDCASVVAAAVEEARAASSPDGPRALDNVFSRV